MGARVTPALRITAAGKDVTFAQNAESDLHFPTRIAHPLDAVAKPAAGRLVVCWGAWQCECISFP